MRSVWVSGGLVWSDGPAVISPPAEVVRGLPGPVLGLRGVPGLGSVTASGDVVAFRAVPGVAYGVGYFGLDGRVVEVSVPPVAAPEIAGVGAGDMLGIVVIFAIAAALLMRRGGVYVG